MKTSKKRYKFQYFGIKFVFRKFLVPLVIANGLDFSVLKWLINVGKAVC